MLSFNYSKQYEIDKNKVILRVKKSPLIVRLSLYLITFLLFFLPISSVIYSMQNGGELKFLMLVMIGFFGLFSFYMLRVSLWNTFGVEVLHFNKDKIIYSADYGWFKDGTKDYEIKEPELEIKQIGYENDSKGVLLIFDSKNCIETVTQIPVKELESLILEIKHIIK